MATSKLSPALPFFCFFFLSACATTRHMDDRLLDSFADHDRYLDEMIFKKHDHVVLAIIVEGISNPALESTTTKQSYLSWRRGIEGDIQTFYERVFLSRYRGYENFEIVDRSQVEKVLSEYQFQYAGYTKQINAEDLGQFLNATHLLIVTFNRTYEKKLLSSGWVDSYQGRLIAVKEARVLSVNQCAYRQ